MHIFVIAVHPRWSKVLKLKNSLVSILQYEELAIQLQFSESEGGKTMYNKKLLSFVVEPAKSCEERKIPRQETRDIRH